MKTQFWLVAVLLSACGSNQDHLLHGVCHPSLQQACTCSDGNQGEQICVISPQNYWLWSDCFCGQNQGADVVADGDATAVDPDAMPPADAGNDSTPPADAGNDATDSGSVVLCGPGGTCDDGNPCTMDQCIGGTLCHFTPYPDNTPCSSSGNMICQSGACVPCGNVGEPCCTGGTSQCTGTLYCNFSDVCATSSTCGGNGQACCPGSSCDSGFACTGTTCHPCGGADQPCCAGATACGSGFTCNPSNNHCECGGPSQPCCVDAVRGVDYCNSTTSYACLLGSCTPCGGFDQPCCTVYDPASMTYSRTCGPDPSNPPNNYVCVYPLAGNPDGLCNHM